MIDNLTDIHDYQNDNNLDFEHGIDTDSIHEHNYDQIPHDHFSDSEYDYSTPQHNEDINPYDSHNPSPNSFDYEINSEPDAYHHDNSANHLSFHSASESDDTVYHEHYWEKPKPYIGADEGSETEYDKNATYGESPEPVSSGCVDNNNNGICDNAEAGGSDSGCSSDD
ncbi:MAG: hypothetical protein VSS75_027205 [Candidatus Parabeggiatoa sp.]|nr:hypothetical protein [Candidatus Parabeggiatoa sp.]